MHWGGYGCGMGFGWTFLVLFWALVILGIAYIVKGVSSRAGQPGPEEKPLDLLKKSYAEGKIAKEEFERMKEDLEKS